MTVNTACRAALQQLREYFSSLGDDSPIHSLSLDEGGVAFTVRGSSGDAVANINVCWTEADNYPNSGCILFGHDAVSVLNERFQDRGELGEVVSQVLRVFGREVDVPCGTPRASAAAMEEDAAAGNDGDVGMEEGSEADWDKVASGSDDNDDYGGDDDEGQDGQPEADDDEDDDEDGDDEDDEDERELIILCSMNLGRWERYEAAMEAAPEDEAGKQVLSTSQGVAAKRQIFNPREAFSMLSRELLDFMRGRHVDCNVDTQGDDLYHWVVDLGSFAEGSALARDMREVSRRYCYSTVRLRLRFMRGLHPFFPPSVEVVWPHLAGPLLGAVASHPMLTLENWDPWRPAMETVAQIKTFLEAHARVNLDNPANDIGRHPHSTYSPLERGLARLEALSGVTPTCLQQPEVEALYAARDSYDRDSARLQALAEGGKKRGRSEPAGPKRTRDVVWARGTGYGSGQEKGELWDAKATEAAQRARDREIQTLLDEMSSSLAADLGPRPPLPLEADERPGRGQATAAGQGASDRQSGEAAAGTAGAAGGPAAMEGVETAEATAAAEASAAKAAAAAAAPEAGAGGGDAVGGAVSTAALKAEVGEGEPRLGAEGCVAVIRASCLMPFVVRELQMASFTDMGGRNEYYRALLSLMRELCRPATHEMLGLEAEQLGQGASGGGPGRSVAAIVRTGLKSAARMYLNVLEPPSLKGSQSPGVTRAGSLGCGKEANKVPAAEGLAAASTSAGIPIARPLDKAAVAAEKAAKEAEGTQRLAQIIMQVAAYLESVAPPAQPPPGVQAEAMAAGDGADGGGAAERAASGSNTSTSAGPDPSAGSLYLTTMKALQVDAVPDLARAHHYYGSARGEQVVQRARSVRLAKEVASLESLLPLSETSSVFVRVDESAVQIWKAIVVGPEDTPYSGGCFVFDLYFPTQYPSAPPQVHLVTTGGGRVRFNPNLYAEGKVCLSLLGTWSGDKGESWNPDVSTAVQVLISIQSLIMVPEPYFNEPSFEGLVGERGKTASRDYIKNVRENCVCYAMLDVLRHPPAAFAEVVRAHFKLRRDPLLDQIKAWADEGQSHNAGHAARLLEMRRELEALIAAL